MNYLIAKSVSEALEYLQKAGGTGRVIAGGTDLMVQMKEGRISVGTLVDISRIESLRSITVEQGQLIIGSAVTHEEVVHSTLVAQRIPTLAKAVRSIGAKQVRNLGTLAGNVITGNPEADGGLMLNALGTSFRVEGPDGERTIPIEALYEEDGKCCIDSTKELITAVCVPIPGEDEFGAYVRTSLRKAMTPALMNVAVMLKIQNGKVARARIAMAPVDVRSKRAWKAEQWLIGQALNEQTIHQAVQAALEDANPMDNPFRGSREYQMQLLSVLIKRALLEAADQCCKAGKTA